VVRSGETCIPARTQHSLQPTRATNTTLHCYNRTMHQTETQDEANIRAARAHSNRSIARRNLLGVASSHGQKLLSCSHLNIC